MNNLFKTNETGSVMNEVSWGGSKTAERTVLELFDIVHSFAQAHEPLHVLKGCSLSLQASETVALLGQSGSGKSTLLHIAGLLETPSGGKIFINGQDTGLLDDKGRTALRRNKIGFVYQFHHLLPEFSALENVMMPQMINGVKRKIALEKAKSLLDSVQLSHRFNHRPSELSGGEQQRVAIARALANDPVILIADEPTGNLDPNTAEAVFNMLQEVVQKQKTALLMATHNLELTRQMSKVLRIKDGVI
ncbi:MAG: ABC transporter ATP-binding protein [Alphaproteobacteria bacterium]|nr:ABC transporter ATP-binding protein [Alphaproteobacteria bacterium]MCL2505759.1 ABC transporter ATP-binding protein [Alphaproteobacteria bacterium]